MKLEFRDIINRHRDKSALIIGHGHSLNNHISRISEYRNKGVVLIGCNEWSFIYTEVPDYIVYASNVDTIVKNKDILNRNLYRTTVFYADSVDLTDREWVEQNITCDYLPYDQRHFNSGGCGSNGKCCEHIIKGRLTIQEELQKFTGHTERYGGGDTVALHMLSFSVFFGCNPIYIVGVDLNYHTGYAINSANMQSKVKADDFDQYKDRILGDFKTIKESAEKIGTKIFNIANNATQDIFEMGSIL